MKYCRLIYCLFILTACQNEDRLSSTDFDDKDKKNQIYHDSDKEPIAENPIIQAQPSEESNKITIEQAIEKKIMQNKQKSDSARTSEDFQMPSESSDEPDFRYVGPIEDDQDQFKNSNRGSADESIEQNQAQTHLALAEAPEEPKKEAVFLGQSKTPFEKEGLEHSSPPSTLEDILAAGLFTDPAQQKQTQSPLGRNIAFNASSMPVSKPHSGSPGGVTAVSLKTFQCRALNKQQDFILHIYDYRINTLGQHPLCEVALSQTENIYEVIAYAQYQRKYCDDFVHTYIENKKTEYDCVAVVSIEPPNSPNT